MKKQLVALGLAAGLVMSPTVYSYAQGNGSADLSEKVKWSDRVGTPEFVSGKLTKASKDSAETIVFNYLNGKEGSFKLGGDAKNSFKVLEKQQDELGFTYLRLQQVYKGTPVFGSVITAHVDKDGVLTALSGAVQPDLDKKAGSKADKVSKKDAISKGEADLTAAAGSQPDYEYAPKADYVIFMKDGTAHYAYHVNYNFLSPEPGNWDYFVDASSGEILSKYNSIDHAKPGGGATGGTNTVGTGTGVLGDTKSLNTLLSGSTYYLQDNTRGKGIFTYDASSRTRLPGTLWADADDQFNASYDHAAVDAHYYAGVTYDYYKNTFNRNSYDNNGAALKASVHYSRNYNNAFWNGSQMVYGDGDGVNFIEFSGGIDVVAHELTHAVTEKTAGLVYQNESGAINESLSDIFGTLVEFYSGKSPDWEIGEDIYTPSKQGDALRSMSDPTKYGDPDNYASRYTGTSDNGGVHTNSGISNKAAYLLSQGGTAYGVKVTGVGTSKTGAIFYRALTQYLTPQATFSQLRAAAVQSAVDLYGSSSQEAASVNAAFDAVGVH
ncbi:M4 family metallopeptidase [Falsibacillus pallidus]|uniref:Neutral metalloproteinase n=1 Tax=Falsibacillus pallidus TaxID=493781 RepID=A0A370G5Y4_9BACI|nr:M4 family metallopeptidase [Falsibacillus pallidus]RDI38466.1 thermolysin [Falsibacillus pallidus]